MTNSLETGGSERQFVALARSLDPATFCLYLGCIMERGCFRGELGRVERFGLGGSLYGVKSFRSRFRLGRYLRRGQIAIAHAFDFYTNLVLVPVAKLVRVPVIIGSQRQIGDLLTPAQSRVQALVFRICDKIICNSQAAADGLRDQGLPESKLTVIRNGVDLSAFADAIPALPRIPGLVRVGMIARMNHRVKNHRMFLQAASALASRFSSLEFVLVGDGPLRGDLEQQAESLGLGNRVRFLGDRRDIPAILASFDITVLPSASESLSNSIMESMAAGVPVIAFRVGGNAELIDRNRGLLVPAREQDLAAGLESLLRNEGLRKSLGRNAKTYAQANFTMEGMRSQHEQLYTDLLQRKGWQPIRGGGSAPGMARML